MQATISRACAPRARSRSAAEVARAGSMPEFSTTHRVPHSASDMFALVADVERYPEFVPLCQAMTMRRREPGEGGREIFLADMTVAYKMFHETFTTRVTLDPAVPRVDVEYVDGPFRHLINRWHFREVSAHSCEVDFFISYEFVSRAMQILTGAVFDRAFRKFVDAFEARADQVYGTATSGTHPGVRAS
jgi:coenzyme Q-binding protein COQ10